MKVLKITDKKVVFYAATYASKGKKWEAFIYGVGWKTYANAIEIEVATPIDYIDLAVAVRSFGPDVTARLIEARYSFYEAQKLSWIAEHFWDITYGSGFMFPINGFVDFIRFDRRLAIMGYYSLDVTETDRLIELSYPDEYKDGTSMAEFIAFKFGKETSDAYGRLIGS